MNIISLQRWHWLVISIAIGLLCGAVRQQAHDLNAELADCGDLIASQSIFESALTTRHNNIPEFKDIFVIPFKLPQGEQVQIVRGVYWNGKPEIINGKEVARWKPTVFVAPIPYAPRAVPSSQPASVATGSVLQYLDSLKPAGVQYRYAWWHWARQPLFQWTAGSFSVLGIIWPTLINLLVYRSLFRPKPEVSISLTSDTPAPSPAPTKPPVPSIDDWLSAQTPADIQATASATQAQTPASTAPVRSLSSQPLTPEEQEAEKAKSYGQKRDDFYPTELRL